MDKPCLFRGNRLVNRNAGDVSLVFHSNFKLFHLQYASLVRPIGKTVTNSLMERLINELLSNSRSWAFREPVNVEEVVDYLEFIKEPMGVY